MGRPRNLNNPVALLALAGVSVARGVSYIGGYMFAELVPPALRYVGPSIPAVPVVIVGLVWVGIGLFLVASMFKWAWFRTAAAITGGAYITWAIVYLGDTVSHFRWGNILSVMVYVFLFVATLTLAQEETKDPEGVHHDR